jgi:hypothetical protein
MLLLSTTAQIALALLNEGTYGTTPVRDERTTSLPDLPGLRSTVVGVRGRVSTMTRVMEAVSWLQSSAGHGMPIKPIIPGRLETVLTLVEMLPMRLDPSLSKL